MAGSGRDVDRPDLSGFPLHTCELCGQDGLTEPDMRSHMLVTHVQTSPACPFCDLGDLSHTEMELHVNSAHLDFLTPESDDMQYLEDGGHGDWGSLWELDKCAGGEGLTGGVADSPDDAVSERRPGPSSDTNPFVDSDVSDTEEDTTVCSVIEKKHKNVQNKVESSPEPLFNSPKRLRASCGNSTNNSSPSSPKLDKSQLSLPIRRRPTGGHDPVTNGTCSPVSGAGHVSTPLSCPLCPYTDTSADSLQQHVNNEHLDTISPAAVSHSCPLCNITCDNVTLLESHVNTVHADVVGCDNASKSPALSCPVCGQSSWNSPAQLQSHVETHFNSPATNSSTINDQLLAQDMQIKERNRLKAEEEAQFASLQAQYGMDEQGNYVQQSVNGLRKAVVSGKLSVVDYYEKSHAMAQSERSGVDDGSSVTRNITSVITRHSNVTLYLASKTDHYASSYGDKGWGCGYRNLQMLLSCLLYTSQYRDILAEKILFNKNNVTMPSISKLQKIIEDAWHQGFDRMGCEQLGGKVVNSRKWIGATEIFTFLSFCNVNCEIIDFHRPTSNDGTHPAMFQWLLDYFRPGGRTGHVIPPVYLQHQGHSRTVVGVEQSNGHAIKLLILDPSHTPDNINSNNVMRMVRKTVNSMKSKQYQLVVVRGVLDTPGLRETKKFVISTRIPP